MLNKKVAIYIPSTVNGAEPAPVELIAKWTKASKVLLAKLFGGFTASIGQGGWYSDVHGLIEENVTIVTAFTDENGLVKVPELRELAEQIAADMRQEAVSVEVDGVLEFISK
jgi:hypothetical protein